MISAGLPDANATGNEIRAEFLRAFILSISDQPSVNRAAVFMQGALITGSFTLVDSHVNVSLAFIDCRFENAPVLNGSRLRSLGLRGGVLPGLKAEGVLFDGALNFFGNLLCNGPIRLLGSRITGDLTFSAAKLNGMGQASLFADRSMIEGTVTFDEGFEAIGEVRFPGAEIKGELVCTECKFTADQGRPSLNLDGARVVGSIKFRNTNRLNGELRLVATSVGRNVELMRAIVVDTARSAICMDGAKITGDVFLNGGFSATGSFLASGVEIGGDLVCTDATFSNLNGQAFVAGRSEIKGALFWYNLKQIDGFVSFSSTRVGVLDDDLSSWQLCDGIALDGMCYQRIGMGPTDASTRVKWLTLQKTRQGETSFWPQPWEQLSKVLREMGHGEDAKQILIEKQRELRKLGLIGTREWRHDGNSLHWLIDFFLVGLSNWIARLSHRLYGTLAGYGYRPMRTLAWMIAAWAFATAIYAWGDNRGLFAPRAGGLLTSDFSAACSDPPARWTHCPKLPTGYNTFDAPMFSLDAILPLVDLKQEADWAPVLRRGPGWGAWDGLIVRGTMWVEILFGWITSLLLVSAVGRLVQKD